MDGRDVNLRLSIGVVADAGREGASSVPPVDIDVAVDRSTVDRLAQVITTLTQPHAASRSQAGAGVPIHLTIKVGSPGSREAAVVPRRVAPASSTEVSDALAQFPQEVEDADSGGLFAFSTSPAAPPALTPDAVAQAARLRRRGWSRRRQTHNYGDYQPVSADPAKHERRLRGASIRVMRARLVEHGRTLQIHAANLGRNVGALGQAVAQDAGRRWDTGRESRAALWWLIRPQLRRAALAALIAGSAGVITGFLAAAPRPQRPTAPPAVPAASAIVASAPAPSPPVPAPVPVTKQAIAAKAPPSRRPAKPAAAAPIRVTPAETSPAVRVDEPTVLTADAGAVRDAFFVGSVLIESQPSGGQVFVNQRPVGVSPLLLSRMRVGSYAVWVDLEGYSLWSRGIRVVSNEQTRVSAMMERLPETVKTLMRELGLLADSPRHPHP